MDPRLAAYGTGAAIFVVDRLTKGLIDHYVPAWDTRVVIPGFFNIIHTKNPGAAFSLLAGASPEWRNAFLISLSLGALALVATLLWQRTGSWHSPSLRLGLSLIFGGALGNIYDRLLYGAVTDFLEFYLGELRWPAFNIADSAITIGAALVVLDMWRSRHAPQRT